MRTAIIAGATGLVGNELLKLLLQHDEYEKIHVLTRRPLKMVHPKLRNPVIDFDLLDHFPFEGKVTDAFCCLGTTMKQAGSRAAFVKVDFEYVIGFAQKAKEWGATRLVVVSSMGADTSSSFFYNRVKGKMEEALKDLNFESLIIVRPALLVGQRNGKRFGEEVARIVMSLFGFLIPNRYKAIRAEQVARKMMEAALKSEKGLTIIESYQLRK